MAKTYLSTIKYEILAKYEVQGIVEKPDIIGAIFGQCEGLLGEDMDLKELQQSGKIGRIEITLSKGKGTTKGEVIIPSSLDQVKTSILAATVETVEKVGPFEAKVNITKINDTRKEKRDIITDRAKELLKKMQKFSGTESSEIASEIKTELRTEKIITYRGLQAGPEVATSPEIIVVEGRADVLRLLSYGINNAVAMNGGNIDAPLIKLCKEKVVTVLIDGDRGGELNLKKLASLTKIDYVARAPDGKEVEELVQKEILLALKRKVSFKDAFTKTISSTKNYEHKSFNKPTYSSTRHDPYSFRKRSPFPSSRTQSRTPLNSRTKFTKTPTLTQTKKVTPKPIEVVEEIPKEIEKLRKNFDKIKGKSKATILDTKYKKIRDVEVKDLLTTVQKSRKKIGLIMFDGIITNRLIEAATKKEIPILVGVKKGNITPNKKIKTYTM